jgi:hypothetical protein
LLTVGWWGISIKATDKNMKSKRQRILVFGFMTSFCTSVKFLFLNVVNENLLINNFAGEKIIKKNIKAGDMLDSNTKMS